MFTRKRKIAVFAETSTDEDLLGLMMAGDESAFTALYRRRHAGVYRFALQMSGSAEIAEDVTQEVFMTLVREARRFDAARGTLVSFLYGVARNHLRRLHEKSRPLVQLSGEHADEEASAAASIESTNAPHDPLSELVRNQTVERLRQCVLGLPPHYREVVVLCDLHEMSYAEAASVLNCAVGTVRSRLHRARSMLLERLRVDAATPSESEAEKVYPVRCLA
ncbi:MAG: RNA polymerase sigma factor [Pyrinomonadaceae bacterium]